MRYPVNWRNIIDWTLFVILFILALNVAMTSNGGETEESWQEVEAAQSVDTDDIEEIIDEQPVKVADAGTGKGVVWGKAKKSDDSKKEDSAEKSADESERQVDQNEDSKKADEKETKKAIYGKKVKKSNQTAGETKTEDAKTQTVEPIEEETTVAPKTTRVNRPTTTALPLPSSMDLSKTTESGEKYLLKSNRRIGSTDLVETLLEVTGDVKQLTDDQKALSDKMEVVAGFRYEERVDQFSLSSGPLISVRQYNLAKAKMKIGDQIKTPELDESMQTIVCLLDRNKVSLFSPKGSLRGEQLLLIEDLPGNTLTLDRLLPNKEVAVGEAWKVPDSVLQSFLSVDAVVESEVEAVLTAVVDNMAMVEVVGDIGGIYLGASTEMSVRAKYQFDLSARRINWLGLLIEENRSVGHVGPGFDLVARLQVKISPLEEPQSLTGDVMKEISVKPTERLLTLKYEGGKGPWRFSHARDWYVYQDDLQSTILRKVHKGELVAQCNIADMGTIDLKSMSSLDRFQQELVDGLGKNFGKVVAAEENENRYGYREFVVLIDGVVEDLPLRWIYYLLTDEEGRQAVVVFVVEASMIEQFDDADRVLVDTFRIGKK